jgi:hypothetical protein
MRWRRRLVRFTKWLSATAFTLLVIAWITTLFGWFQWVPNSGRYLICNSHGSLIIDWIPGYHGRPDVYWIPHSTGYGLRFGPYLETKPLQSEWRWRPRLIRKEGLTRALLILPIWPPIALAAAAWLALQWRDLVYSYRGWCYRCDYDCRALPPSSPCPECGRPGMVKPPPAPSAPTQEPSP